MTSNRDLLSSGGGFVTTGGAEIAIVVNDFEQRWSFSAKENGTGAPKGQFEFKEDLFGSQISAHGDIICFAVEGNRARLGAVVTNSNFLPEGTQVVWNVEDNGEGNAINPDLASTFQAGTAVGFAKDFCLTSGSELTTYPVERGNVQVHD